MIEFVDQVYIPDLLAIAPYYLDYASLGEGLGNFLTWGELPDTDNSDTSKFIVPRSVILNRDLAQHPGTDPAAISRGCRNSLHTPGMTKALAIMPVCIRARAKPSSITRGPSRPTKNWKSSKSIPGSRLLAGQRRRWKLVPWRVSWPCTQMVTNKPKI